MLTHYSEEGRKLLLTTEMWKLNPSFLFPSLLLGKDLVDVTPCNQPPAATGNEKWFVWVFQITR